MASDLLLVPSVYRCYYCQFESKENAFKYFDNKKVDQPRHQCHQCHKLFTLGSHGRPQGRTYAKKRNEDPPELKKLSCQCRHCGVANNALFKYYNNGNCLQPRFKCLSCGKQFQIRLMGTGDETHLVHTSCNPRQATGRCKKPREPKAFTNASDCGARQESYVYQPSDGSFMPEPSDLLMPLESSGSCEEDVQYASFLEGELTDENESPNADSMISCDPTVDNGLLPELSVEEAELLALLELDALTNEKIEEAPNVEPILLTLHENEVLPLGLSGTENAEFLAFLEAGFLTDGSEALWNVDTSSFASNVDDGLQLLPWSDNATDLIELTETCMRADGSNDVELAWEKMNNYMVSDCTSNPEVVSGPLLVETLAPAEPPSWSHDTIEESSSPNYLEAALACCKLMDMIPVAPVKDGKSSSSSSTGLTISFGASSCDTSELVSPFPQDLMEEDQCSLCDWNEWQEEANDMEIAPWA